MNEISAFNWKVWYFGGFCELFLEYKNFQEENLGFRSQCIFVKFGFIFSSVRGYEGACSAEGEGMNIFLGLSSLNNRYDLHKISDFRFLSIFRGCFGSTNFQQSN